MSTKKDSKHKNGFAKSVVKGLGSLSPEQFFKRLKNSEEDFKKNNSSHTPADSHK